MHYRYKVRFRNMASGGSDETQNPETGEVTPGTPAAGSTVIEGWADVQDAGVARPLTAQGAPVKDADSTWFMKNERLILDIEPGFVAEVWYPPTYERWAEGNVVATRELDGAVDVKYR